ncbi:MAG: hypothetical protein WEC37_05260, partial [Anaerolineales bacterium]
LSLGFGGSPGRLPALPNAAWFFFASAENHLSLQKHQRGSGAFATAYASPHIPAPVFLFALPAIPFLAWRPSSRLLRRAASRVIQQDMSALELDVREWHRYSLDWQSNDIRFEIDQRLVLSSQLKPRPPLALVLWIDNQFAAWRPDGSLAYGTLATGADCWIEIKDIRLS